MNLKEFIDRNFAGNTSAFARAYDITYNTALRLREGRHLPRKKLWQRLKRKGVHF